MRSVLAFGSAALFVLSAGACLDSSTSCADLRRCPDDGGAGVSGDGGASGGAGGGTAGAGGVAGAGGASGTGASAGSGTGGASGAAAVDRAAWMPAPGVQRALRGCRGRPERPARTVAT